MLEVKNLVKTYSSKKGVAVHALDGVSIKFPETGMVLGVSAIATGIPVVHTSRKSPVESIRAL